MANPKKVSVTFALTRDEWRLVTRALRDKADGFRRAIREDADQENPLEKIGDTTLDAWTKHMRLLYGIISMCPHD